MGQGSAQGEPEIAWDDPAARDGLVSVLVNDALAVLAGSRTSYPGGDGLEPKAAEAVALLALVAGQDVEPAEGSTAATGAGGSPAAPPRTGSSSPSTRHPARARVPRTLRGRLQAHVVVDPTD